MLNQTLFTLFVFTLLILATSTNIQSKEYVGQTPIISGLDVVGCGFDITNLRSKRCLLDISQASGISNWTDPANSSTIFIVPDGFYAFEQSESLNIDRTIIVKSVHDYISQSIYTTNQDKNGFLGFGSSHKTKQIGYLYRRIYENTYYLAITLRQIVWYTLMAATFPPPKLNPLARKALDTLPVIFDPSNSSNILKFHQFFNAYGTHIVTQSAMGGLIWAQDWFENCLLIVRNESWIRQQVRKKHDPFGIFRSSSDVFHTDIVLDKEFKNSTDSKLSLLGGTESISIEKWKDWIPTIKYDPRPVSYRLQPIYILLSQGDQRRETLMDATLHFRSEIANEATKYIERLQSVPKPPSTTCPTSRRKRSINFEITNEARAALCPYSSYTGLVCPGASKSFLLSSRQLTTDPIKMARSIGMGLDIANGDIKFMALNLTYDESKILKIPSTGRLLVPFKEVIFQLPNSIDDTKMLTRSFGSVSDMIKQWDDALSSGEIGGGEFSRLLNTEEYKDLFNSDNTVDIVITQERYPTYRLKIDRSKGQLNFFAQQAVSQLTTEYNYDLYAEFFNTFGTHIIVRTVVGGMSETKIKQLDSMRCIRNMRRPNYNCGFRPHPIQEILSKKRLGGFVDLADEQTWTASIDIYPAVLKVLDFAQWSEFSDDPLVKENLDRATQEYLEKIRTNI